MKPVEKVLAAGGLMLAGYLVGFYDMKYRMLKVLLKVATRNEEDESQE